MRSISFSLIALSLLACEPAQLVTDSAESLTIETDFFSPQVGEGQPDYLDIPDQAQREPFGERLDIDPKLPEIDNEQAEPEPDGQEIEEPDAIELDEPVGQEEPAAENADSKAIECGVFILKPRSHELHAGEKLLAEWQVTDDILQATHIGLVTEGGEDQKLVELEGKRGTTAITLPKDLEPGLVRLFIGAKDIRQSWFCKDSSYITILP